MNAFYYSFIFLCINSMALSTIHINVQKNEARAWVPPSYDFACMARYIVHHSNWCSLSYISNRNNLTGYPASRVFSISDGTTENSTGVIYFMVSPMDLTIQDLFVDNRCSVIMTLAQSHYCYENKFDAQDPRCAQTIITGTFKNLTTGSIETDTAKAALWARHPVMKFWYNTVTSHKWFFAKVEIEQIALVDRFGGRSFPSISDYFNQNSECIRNVSQYYDLNDINLSIISVTNE